MNRRLGRCVAGAVLASMTCLAPPLRAQADTAHAAHTLQARLVGVYDAETGDPIAGAEVTDELTGDHVATSATGTASLAFVHAARSVIQVRKVGYEPWKQLVDLTVMTPITLVLKHAVAELPAVVTNAKVRIETDAGKREGFEQRCELTPHIACLHEADLLLKASHGLGDLLMHTDAVVCRAAKYGCDVAMHGAAGGKCDPTVYVDGLRWDTKAMGRAFDEPGVPGSNAPFNAYNVKEVEVYPTEGTRPMRWAGDPNCGAIVLWTK